VLCALTDPPGSPRARARHQAGLQAADEGNTVEMLRYGRPPTLGAIWIVVGVVVAAIYDYFDSLDTAGEVLSLLVAVIFWPILLFGFDVQIRR
jgi:hypothetical protein